MILVNIFGPHKIEKDTWHQLDLSQTTLNKAQLNSALLRRFSAIWGFCRLSYWDHPISLQSRNLRKSTCRHLNLELSTPRLASSQPIAHSHLCSLQNGRPQKFEVFQHSQHPREKGDITISAPFSSLSSRKVYDGLIYLISVSVSGACGCFVCLKISSSAVSTISRSGDAVSTLNLSRSISADYLSQSHLNTQQLKSAIQVGFKRTFSFIRPMSNDWKEFICSKDLWVRKYFPQKLPFHR